MKKYAKVINETVTDILDIDETEVSKLARTSLLIDVDDIYPTPEVGWKLVGNRLQYVASTIPVETLEFWQQEAQQKHGVKILPIVINKLGARNLKLAREGVTVDVVTMVGQMATLKVLLETGALKTARGMIYQMTATHTNHSDILNEAMAMITNFLTEKGWN